MSQKSRDVKKAKKPLRLQEHIEWLAMAFVLALTVKCFIVEAYQIPTGSMAPTLYGDHYQIKCPSCGARLTVRGADGTEGLAGVACPSCGEDANPKGKVRLHGGDRILVAKDLYPIMPPKRWDVFVFKSPEMDKQSKNFVKRLIGLPGERIELRNGQVFVDGRIVRKPPRVQRALWQNVYEAGSINGPSCWKSSGSWHAMREGLLLAEPATTLQVIEYARPIVDFSPYDGRGGDNVVGDILVSGHARFEQDGGSLAVATYDDVSTVRAIFTPSDGILLVELRRSDELISEVSSRIPVPQDFDFCLAVVDGSLEVSVNGVSVARREYDLAANSVPLYTQSSGVFFEGMGSRILVKAVQIKRDVYYRASLRRSDRSYGQPFAKDVPEGCYLGLGDNSPVSYDSREWGVVPEASVLGKAFFVFWPPARIKPVS